MKLRFTLLFSLLLCISGFAQEFKYGISAGLHKTSIRNIHDYSKGKFGGDIGFFGNWALVENDVWDSAWLYLEPKVEFSMQGENANPPEGFQKFHYNYVAMSVYLKYFFHRGNLKRDVFVFGGPRIEYMVSHKTSGPPNYEMFAGMEDRLNKFGYGVSFGTGLKISQQWEGTLRYDWGFNSVYPDYTYGTTYNRMLSIGLNYYLSSNW